MLWLNEFRYGKMTKTEVKASHVYFIWYWGMMWLIIFAQGAALLCVCSCLCVRVIRVLIFSSLLCYGERRPLNDPVCLRGNPSHRSPVNPRHPAPNISLRSKTIIEILITSHEMWGETFLFWIFCQNWWAHAGWCINPRLVEVEMGEVGWVQPTCKPTGSYQRGHSVTEWWMALIKSLLWSSPSLWRWGCWRTFLPSDLLALRKLLFISHTTFISPTCWRQKIFVFFSLCFRSLSYPIILWQEPQREE